MKLIPALLLLALATSCGETKPDSHKVTDSTQGTVPEDIVPEQLKPGSKDTAHQHSEQLKQEQ